jgi:alpha-D-ribose 1-methylphosphonate 5-triphosphate synthase subunit PhnH
VIATTSSLPGAARRLTDASAQDSIRVSQHLFRVLLDALANPGTVRPLVVHPLVAQTGASFNPWLASVLVTLLDHEVSLHVDGDAALGEFLQRRTRVALADAGSASFVVASVATMPDDLPEQLRQGSLAYPDDGATLLLEVPGFAPEESAGLDLRLIGPGIEGERMLHVSGLPAAFLESRDRANAGYPMGIDVLLFDASGNVVGLPRTTGVVVAGKDVN